MIKRLFLFESPLNEADVEQITTIAFKNAGIPISERNNPRFKKYINVKPGDHIYTVAEVYGNFERRIYLTENEVLEKLNNGYIIEGLQIDCNGKIITDESSARQLEFMETFTKSIIKNVIETQGLVISHYEDEEPEIEDEIIKRLILNTYRKDMDGYDILNACSRIIDEIIEGPNEGGIMRCEIEEYGAGHALIASADPVEFTRMAVAKICLLFEGLVTDEDMLRERVKALFNEVRIQDVLIEYDADREAFIERLREQYRENNNNQELRPEWNELLIQKHIAKAKVNSLNEPFVETLSFNINSPLECKIALREIYEKWFRGNSIVELSPLARKYLSQEENADGNIEEKMHTVSMNIRALTEFGIKPENPQKIFGKFLLNHPEDLREQSLEEYTGMLMALQNIYENGSNDLVLEESSGMILIPKLKLRVYLRPFKCCFCHYE